MALSKLDPTKSTGHDLLRPKILKIASRELSYPLADLYNRCIGSCDWPLQWTKGDWAVFKKDNKQAPVVRRVDSAIHWMTLGFASAFPLDSDLSGG